LHIEKIPNYYLHTRNKIMGSLQMFFVSSTGKKNEKRIVSKKSERCSELEYHYLTDAKIVE